MTGMPGSFDASQFKPQQGFDKVLPGRYPFRISNTEVTPTKDQTGGMFVVTFNTPAGSIQSRYNIWNQSPKAVEIAHGQLSALCHATGVFRLNWQDEGSALRNAEGMIDVGWQNGQEPTPEKPEGGYTEVKRVLDRNGNEPGKASAPPPPQLQPQAQPMTQQPNGGWGASQGSAPQAPSNQNPPNSGWGAPPNQPQQSQPNQATNPQWSQSQPQQGAAPGKPPWAS